MLYVVVELPLRMKFNPFATPAIFDIFQGVKNSARQNQSPLISYQTDLGKIKTHIDSLSTTTRFLLLTMNASTRFDIDTRVDFIGALVKAEFQIGMLRREIKLTQALINSQAVLPTVPNQPKVKQSAPVKISVPVRKQLFPFSAQIQKHLETSGLPTLQMHPPHPTQSKPVPLQPVKTVSKTDQIVKPVPQPIKVVKPAPNPAPVVVPQPIAPALNRVELIVNPPIVQEEAPKPLKQLPFNDIPSPDLKLVENAHKVAAALGDDLPIDCLDPISMEVLSDPIEINRRVYDRETIDSMVKDGKFPDPFTGQEIELSTMKPAHFMLEAIIEHKKVLDGEKPALLGKHAETNCISLKGILEQWEKMLQAPKQEMK